MEIDKFALKSYSDVSFKLESEKSKNAFLVKEQRKCFGLLLLVSISLVVMNSSINYHGNKYFPLDNNGSLKSFIPYSIPVGSFEERSGFAYWLVRNLNSLSYIDKDKTLSSLEMYFDPMVFKQYIIKQYSVGYFKQMMRYSLSYDADVRPALDINGKKTSLLLSDESCYLEKMDAPGCRLLKIGINHSETHLFDLVRTIHLPGGKKQEQKYQARITLTRTDVTKSPFPYLVSEYTEII